MWSLFLILSIVFHSSSGQGVESNIQNVSGIVTKMSLELQRLQSELRAVASIASQCADAKEAVRQHENDHTVLYWIKVWILDFILKALSFHAYFCGSRYLSEATD